MTTQILRTEHDGAVARIWLSRPEVRNAINAELIAALLEQLELLRAHPPRVLVLGGDGPVFCAGADAQWMAETGQLGWDANYADALTLGDLFAALNTLPCAVIGRVQGGAYGGGLGLLACCDAVVTTDTARFSFGEVRLGLTPATIAPYVLARAGLSATRELFLNATRFDAEWARQIGLVHELAPEGELDSAVERRVQQFLQNSPAAIVATKQLLAQASHVSTEQREQLARLIAQIRGSDEGREGLAAFLDKRKPSWAE